MVPIFPSKACSFSGKIKHHSLLKIIREGIRAFKEVVHTEKIDRIPYLLMAKCLNDS